MRISENTIPICQRPGWRLRIGRRILIILGMVQLSLTGAGAGAGAITGTAVAELAPYDTEIQAFMTRWRVAGAAVAVARHGKLLYARGFGVADTETGAPVLPDSLFRIASVSKPVTAAAILKLAEDGAITLDIAAFPYLSRGTPTDPRLAQITIRHLLEHTAGWDRDIAGDPMFMSHTIADVMGVASPPDPDTILRWMLMQPLQYNPGSRYAYSNFGYAVLGQIIAKASGQTYENYVRTLLLKAGITRMKLGGSLLAGRAEGEVAYYMPTNAPLANSVFAAAPGVVPWPYGGYALEPMAAHGGWIASAIDLVAFAAALDRNTTRVDMLTADSLATMSSRPVNANASASYWYSKGWLVNSTGNLWHTGSLPGTSSLLVNAANGMQWAVLLNTRSETDTARQVLDLDNTMWAAYAKVTTWPTTDQFATLHNNAPMGGCFGEASLNSGVLCVPILSVTNADALPTGVTATLSLNEPATMTFELVGVTAVSGPTSGMSVFNSGNGLLNIPRVLLPDLSGTPSAYGAQLQLLSGGPPFKFKVVAGKRL